MVGFNGMEKKGVENGANRFRFDQADSRAYVARGRVIKEDLDLTQRKFKR